jgi:hypothetical protein
MKEKFLSTADASRVLGVTPAAVRLMVVTGRLKPTASTEGGIQLFKRSTVERLAARRKAELHNLAKEALARSASDA